MTKQEIQAALTAVITEVEKRCGREGPQGLSGSLRPVVDLGGWDSLLGVEATVILERELGKELGVESVFVTDDDCPRARTVDEIISLLDQSLARELVQ